MDSKTQQEILDFLVNELGGDWLLTGGGLVRLEFDASRGTEDLDLVRIAHAELSDEAARDRLFRWLIGRGLGPEWVNSAVEPFVREVPNWAGESVVLLTGSRGRVFRPNLTLFTYLKLRRGTEIDLKDVSAALKCCPEGFDEMRFLSWASNELRQRFQSVRSRLGM